MYIYTFFIVVFISLYREAVSHKWPSLNDFFFNPNTPNISRGCLEESKIIYLNLKNDTLWAKTIFDSMVKVPYGVLHGSYYQLGNYQECLTPLYQGPVRSKYCLAGVELQIDNYFLPYEQTEVLGPYSKTDKMLKYISYGFRAKRNKVYWGICMPQACNYRDVKEMLDVHFNSHALDKDIEPLIDSSAMKVNIYLDKDSCQSGDENSKLPSFYIIFIGLVLIIVGCTTAHVLNPSSSDVVQALSLGASTRRLLAPDAGPLRVLHAVRALCAAVVVLLHRLLMDVNSPSSNLHEIEQIINASWWSVPLVRIDLVVDIFLMLSGLLTMRSLITKNKKTEVFVSVIRRYIRLAPYLVTVLYGSTVFSQKLGPVRHLPVKIASECRAHWVADVLMLAPFFNIDRICFKHLWYVFVDFYLYMFALFLGMLGRSARISIMIIVLLTSVVSYGIFTGVYDAAPYPHITTEFLLTKGSRMFVLSYCGVVTRASSYIVGCLAAELSCKFPSPSNDLIKKVQSCRLFLLGLLILMSVLVWSTWILEAVRSGRTLSQFGWFSGLNRLLWSMGSMMILISLIYGKVPIVSKIFGMRWWVIPARLSYSIYLFHYVIMIEEIVDTYEPKYFHLWTVIVHYAGDLVRAILAAILMYLLVEEPSRQLIEIIISKLRRTGNGKHYVKNASKEKM